MTYYMIRHGLATIDPAGYGTNIKTAEILKEGIPAVKKIGEYMKNIKTEYNVSSEYLRCKQTVEIISKINGKNFVFDKRINEYNEITYSNFMKNIKSFMDEGRSKKYKNVFICSHAAVLNVIVLLIKKTSVSENDLITNYPLPGILLIVNDANIKMLDFNN